MDKDMGDILEVSTVVLVMAMMLMILVPAFNNLISLEGWNNATSYIDKNAPIAEGELIPVEPTYDKNTMLLVALVQSNYDGNVKIINLPGSTVIVDNLYKTKRTRYLNDVYSAIKNLPDDTEYKLYLDAGEDTVKKESLNGKRLTNGITSFTFR